MFFYFLFTFGTFIAVLIPLLYVMITGQGRLIPTSTEATLYLCDVIVAILVDVTLEIRLTSTRTADVHVRIPGLVAFSTVFCININTV